MRGNKKRKVRTWGVGPLRGYGYSMGWRIYCNQNHQTQETFNFQLCFWWKVKKDAILLLPTSYYHSSFLHTRILFLLALVSFGYDSKFIDEFNWKIKLEGQHRKMCLKSKKEKKIQGQQFKSENIYESSKSSTKHLYNLEDKNNTKKIKVTSK